MEDKVYRTHPIMIFFNLKQFLVLAIIPIVRGLISAFRGSFSDWSEGLWLDLVILGLILLFAFLSWWRSTYTFDDKFLRQKQGLFFSKVTTLPWDKVSVIKTYHPFYIRVVGACYFRADSLGGMHQKADISFCITPKKAQTLYDTYEKVSGDSKEAEVLKPRFMSILALALISTNSFVGVFYLATFVNQTGRLLGKEFSDMLVSGVETIARTLSQHVPPAATATATLIFFAWIVGVLFTLMRYYKFTAVRTKNTLTLNGGLFSSQHQSVAMSQINYITIRQNVITYFFRVYSLYLSAVGIGKERSDISCVVPINKKENFEENQKLLFPEFHSSGLKLRPAKRGFMRFLYEPLATIGFVLLLMLTGIHFVPSWRSFIIYVGLMAMVPAVGFFIMRIVEYKTCGVGKNTTTYTLTYSTGFTLNTIIIPKNKVVKIEVRQGIFQQVSGKCDLLVYTAGEKPKRHKCRSLERQQVIDFFNIDESITQREKLWFLKRIH